MSREERMELAGIFEALKIIDGHLHTIMATDAELTAKLTAVADSLDAANTEITKVSGETTGLIAAVAKLQALIDAGGTISPALSAAADAVEAKANAVSAGLKSVDDLVPDAPTP
jgi:hypothetical protein